MKVKTLTGPTIQAALAEARRVLGDEVVLLESIPPEGDRPARVVVMVDVPSRRTEESSLRTSILAVSPTLREAHDRGIAIDPESLSAHPRRTRGRDAGSAALLEEDAGRGGGFSVARGGYGTTVTGGRPPAPFSLRPAADEDEEEMPSFRPMRRRGNLYPTRPEVEVEPAASNAQPTESLVEAQLRMLNDRLKHLESCFGETMIGASLQWASHPLFARLLEQGVRPATAAKLFDRVAAKGHTPNTEAEMLRWSLAQEIRNMIDVDAPKVDSGTLVLIGPSGSGKTSLALKLAKHPSFYGRRRATVIVIQPELEESVAYHSPVDLYRRFGIPVQSVRTQEDMAQALERVQRFDQVIIDTPSLSVREPEARKVLTNVKRLTAPVLPLQVQLVVNATRVLDQLNVSFIKNLPLKPDTLTLTHLDDTDGWGRVAEWIATLGLPVRSVSNGPRVPDDLVAFSPSWFVEEMMQL